MPMPGMAIPESLLPILRMAPRLASRSFRDLAFRSGSVAPATTAGRSIPRGTCIDRRASSDHVSPMVLEFTQGHGSIQGQATTPARTHLGTDPSGIIIDNAQAVRQCMHSTVANCCLKIS